LSTKSPRFTRGTKIPILWRPRVICWATKPINPRPDLTCLTTYPYTPPGRDTHPILILASADTHPILILASGHDTNSQTSLNSSISWFSSSQMRPTQVSLLRVFFFLLFFLPKEQVLLCLGCGRWRITQILGPRAREILPSLRILTNEAERTLDLPRRRSRHGKSPWLSTE